MAKPKKSKKLLLILIVLIAVGAAIYFKFIRADNQIASIQSEKAMRRNLTEVVIANGKVQPVTQVVINPEVSGEIISLPVKEGQFVKRGDLLVKIKPDTYIANRNSAQAGYESAIAGGNLAKANLEKAQIEFDRAKQLSDTKLISDSQFLEAKTALDIAKAQYDSSIHQVDVAKAAVDRAEEDLIKTTIRSPIDGTVTRLRSELGERVLGTSYNVGTEIMTIANLDEMEARVDIGEIDIVLIKTGQVARLEVDAFRDTKFSGRVTEIANASKSAGGTAAAMQSSSQSQDATRFEVKIRINEKEAFRPGMSVTSEVETRYRTNILSIPIQSVTTRLPKTTPGKSNLVLVTANAATNPVPTGTTSSTNSNKKGEGPKAIEVVFLVEGDHAKMVQVKRGISDENYVEVLEGVKEGEEIISGGYKALSRDLEDGKKIVKGEPEKLKDEEKKR
jgi:HlyD family secretion protein